jgi:multidrug resistance efflux pump
MLNVSPNRIEGKIDRTHFKAFTLVRDNSAKTIFTRLLVFATILLLILAFLPWTQNIRSRGMVTTLYPEQRPQTIHSIIAGRVERWYVQEGDFVKKGDTILNISEIKDEYFDPQLLTRTEEQIKAKELSVESYMEKVKALDRQIDALLITQKLKIEQAENYVEQAHLMIESDSIDLEAAKINLEIAEKQFQRMEQLYAEGLMSLTDLEQRKLKLQETQAKFISAENKLLKSRNELINAQVELSSIENQYRDKMSKAASEKFTAMSTMYDAEAMVTKMQNQYMNYSVRTGYYYITAPQDGFVTQVLRVGIGETVKEGEALVSVMPSRYDLAVALFIEPIDLPLIARGQNVQFRFDGWPAIAFSGWPNLAHGTFSGEVVAIDNFISKNGKYRILVAPNPREEPWPEELRVGAGADGIALLKDVPVWYEVWRQLNGFPPDYYKIEEETKSMEAKEDKG